MIQWRRWFRPALWSSVVALHAAALGGTAWVQWRAAGERPAILVTVMPAPPPPPPRTPQPPRRTAAPARRQQLAQPQRTATVARTPAALTRRRVAVRARAQTRGATAPAARTIVMRVSPQEPATNATGPGSFTAPSADATPSGPSDREAVPLAGCPQPAYPRAARRAGHEGLVLLRVHLDAMGHVCAVELDRTSGHRALDRAAREAVLRWRFAPRFRDGAPVSCELVQPVSFRLR